VLAVTWWVLSKGAYDSWLIGVPAILAAICLDFFLFRPKVKRWALGGLIVFALFFLKSSITSGIDVVWRTYHPRMPMNPAMVEYPLSLASSTARYLFAGTVSLLPGTLSAELDEDRLVVHVLDVGRPFEQELKIIEDRVAAIFPYPADINYHLTGTD
jgi:multicomponent Na+:H+ antiporter subunit E